MSLRRRGLRVFVTPTGPTALGALFPDPEGLAPLPFGRLLLRVPAMVLAIGLAMYVVVGVDGRCQ
jgi:hypothetical protein